MRKMMTVFGSLLFFPIIGVTNLQAEAAPKGVASVSSAQACSALVGTIIAKTAIGLPTSGARIMSAHEGADTVCTVKGAIDPVDPHAPAILFQLNLPARWNDKAVQFGGGGLNGTVVTGRNPDFLPADREPAVSGYATFGSNSGHVGAGGDPSKAAADGSFALNAEARENFAYAQLKKTHDVAVQLIRRRYGRTPAKLYFYGGSEGGREALTVAQRWPEAYAGIVAIHPAWDFTSIMIGNLRHFQTLHARPGAWFSPQQAAALGQAVLSRCDALDGLADGVVANVAACRTAFDVNILRCPGDVAQPSCLTRRQIESATTLAQPASLHTSINRVTTLGGLPIFEGALATESWEGFGSRPVPSTPPTFDDSWAFTLADQATRFLILRDPATNSMTFNPQSQSAAIARLSDLMDIKTADFDRFRRRGGKLILIHGSIDITIPPANSIAYFNHLHQRYGRSLSSFARFYIVPGFGHGGGAFPMSLDSLSALDQWVSSGKQPSGHVATSQGGARPGSARPLCEYPKWAKYDGTGDPMKATSFRCVLP